QATAVAGGVDAAGEGGLARLPHVVALVPAVGRRGERAEGVARSMPVGIVGRVRQVGRRVEAIDLDPGLGDESPLALGAAPLLGHGADDAERPSLPQAAGRRPGHQAASMTHFPGSPEPRSEMPADASAPSTRTRRCAANVSTWAIMPP